MRYGSLNALMKRLDRAKRGWFSLIMLYAIEASPDDVTKRGPQRNSLHIPAATTN